MKLTTFTCAQWPFQYHFCYLSDFFLYIYIFKKECFVGCKYSKYLLILLWFYYTFTRSLSQWRTNLCFNFHFLSYYLGETFLCLLAMLFSLQWNGLQYWHNFPKSFVFCVLNVWKSRCWWGWRLGCFSLDTLF